mmetsp:Transcript_60669/g.175627  ORF Transcript_60669/g.175627 Transcript_60669/m.175627 type:complete len:98 (-) Transcript_60669:162-455(-)
MNAYRWDQCFFRGMLKTVQKKLDDRCSPCVKVIPRYWPMFLGTLWRWFLQTQSMTRMMATQTMSHFTKTMKFFTTSKRHYLWLDAKEFCPPFVLQEF